MSFVTCKDCIYGDCSGGFNRSCQVFPSIGKTMLVPDNFFCTEKGKSREQWKKEYAELQKGGAE